VTDDLAAPRAVRALWGHLDEPPRRGPKPAMSVPEIARAGIAIADSDGLPAVSMAAVAKRLGFTTMSLYRYVDSRDELLLVMVDVAYGPVPDISRRSGWRRQIEDWARAEAASLVAHPWALDVRPGTPPLAPNTLAWMDRGLAALERSALNGQQAASSLLLVDGFVRNHVGMALQFADVEGTRRWSDQVRAVFDRQGLPSLAAALDAGVFDDEDDDSPGQFPGDEFEFGLGLVLDGIDALIRRQA
jgi:AcrR family transcriptional regulator